MIERQTYSGLEWLGDVGGLYDALSLISTIILAPLTGLQANSFLLSSVYRQSTKLGDPSVPKNVHSEPDLQRREAELMSCELTSTRAIDHH